MLVCPKDGRVIQLHTESVLKGHVVVHRSVALLPANYKAASAISVDPQLFLQRAISLESSHSINITLADGLELYRLSTWPRPRFDRVLTVNPRPRSGEGNHFSVVLGENSN